MTPRREGLTETDKKRLGKEYPKGVDILINKGLFGIDTRDGHFVEPSGQAWMNLKEGFVTKLKVGKSKFISGYRSMDGRTPHQASQGVLYLLEEWHRVNLYDRDVDEELYGGILAEEPIMTTINSEAGRRVLVYLEELYPGRVVVPERRIAVMEPPESRNVLFSIGGLEVSTRVKKK